MDKARCLPPKAIRCSSTCQEHLGNDLASDRLVPFSLVHVDERDKSFGVPLPPPPPKRCSKFSYFAAANTL